MRPRVYIETTIPSFYFEVRAEPQMAAQREWTRTWWDTHRFDYSPVTGVPVLLEIERGEYPSKSEVAGLVRELPVLEITDDVRSIIKMYIEHSLMPAAAMGDAAHLALASYYRCDFLLTWNCRHLANANKFRHIEVINRSLGIFVPTIVTPLALLGPVV